MVEEVRSGTLVNCCGKYCSYHAILKEGTDVGLNDVPLDGSVNLYFRFVTSFPNDALDRKVVVCKATDRPIGWIADQIALIGDVVDLTGNSITVAQLASVMINVNADHITDIANVVSGTTQPVYVTDQGLLTVTIPDATAGAVNWQVGYVIGGAFTSLSGNQEWITMQLFDHAVQVLGTVAPPFKDNKKAAGQKVENLAVNS